MRSVRADHLRKIARLKHTERWARMAGRKGKAPASGTVLLQKVSPEIPSSPEELKVLRTHLEMMGCDGLLGMPWAFKSEVMVTELLGKPPTEYADAERGHPEKWTRTVWKDTYNFRNGDVKVAERNDDVLKGEFLRNANPKEGYVFSDLRRPEARLVIGFLNPIFHPEKPKRVVAKLASLFLGSMRGDFSVDWASFMEEQVDRMVKNLPKAKKTATPLSTYLAHLYAKKGMLKPAEQDEFDALVSIQLYGGPETESEKEDSDEEETPPSSPLVTRRNRKRSRSVQKEPAGEQAGPSEIPEERATQLPEVTIPQRPVPAPDQPQPAEQGSGPTQGPEMTGHTVADIAELCQHIVWRSRIQELEVKERTTLIAAIMQEAGVLDLDDLFPRLKDLRVKEIRLEQHEGNIRN